MMAIASGMDKHGGDSADPIAYTHIDIAGSSVTGVFTDGVVTGSPVLALTAHYVLGSGSH